MEKGHNSVTIGGARNTSLYIIVFYCCSLKQGVWGVVKGDFYSFN